jgi:hypothetical protein
MGTDLSEIHYRAALNSQMKSNSLFPQEDSNSLSTPAIASSGVNSHQQSVQQQHQQQIY